MPTKSAEKGPRHEARHNNEVVIITLSGSYVECM